ncbi:MAG: STAS domain-containing protein [Rhodoferax sp.]|nr:MAG: STAS domain-containing protein [Rhodoferax sp.]
MATKDDRPNLLSKVALFVRNPTKDWSELDNADSTLHSGYDRGALKAAIERKRQNDFVRKREFDQLRKLRKSAANGEVAQVRPSAFQTSTVTDPDARALTLKKIDEIEAQMSKQWWKSKGEGVSAGPGEPPAAPDAQSSAPASSAPTAPAASTNFASTEPQSDSAPAAEFAATQAATGLGALPTAPRPAQTVVAQHVEVGFSTSQLFANAQDMTTDPELEEAAIRFANSDDAGAEAVLLQAMRSEPGVAEVAMSWLAALLDLYRATGNRSGFDQAVMEFSWRFPALAPKWLDYREVTVAEAVPEMVPDAALLAHGPDVLWRCPAQLDRLSMEQLRDILSTNPMPWKLDWSAFEGVQEDALPLLAGLFGSLCAEPVAVEFRGASTVASVLRALTPSSDRNVPHAHWVLRLDALRVMQRIDDFEMAALDYCVTYEAAPPPWMPAACQYSELELPSSAAVADATGTAPLNTVPMRMEAAPPPDVSLRGVLAGDASAALAAAGMAAKEGSNVVVSCAALLRVDFAAAGSILNWVAMQQPSGCSIQFVDVNRLVAAFFNVIGINEHARVTPRNL